MRKTNLVLAICMAIPFLAVLSTATSTQAQLPGAPAYLHAITDLRLARAYIQADPHREHPREKQHAIDEITAAIQEIKRASIDDGKGDNYAPPTDSRGMASGPIHEALRLIRKAHDDATAGIDLPNAIGMKFRALKHIDEAEGTLKGIMVQSGTY
jgi:hypothetical protein